MSLLALGAQTATEDTNPIILEANLASQARTQKNPVKENGDIRGGV